MATIRASAYGAALGDPARYPNATAAYRTAGLAPAEYSSAGNAAGGQPISREGRKELRTAIVELGKGLARFEPDFDAYKAGLVARKKPKKVVVNIAVGRRAHRLAFAMMRDQTVYDPTAWRAGVAAGRTVMDDTWPARYDVAAPPDHSMTDHDQEHNQNRQLVGS